MYLNFLKRLSYILKMFMQCTLFTQFSKCLYYSNICLGYLTNFMNFKKYVLTLKNCLCNVKIVRVVCNKCFVPLKKCL